MKSNLLKNNDFDLARLYFYNPGAEIDNSFYLKKTLDWGVISFFTPNPIKSLREHLNILDNKHLWKWC
jgi:hypothetical protein